VIFWKQKGERAPLEFVAEVSDPNEEDSILQMIREIANQPSGSRAEEVMVTAIDEEKFERYEEPRGKAKPVKLGQKFRSAWALSLHLGYPHNAVVDALSRDRRRQDAAHGPGHTVRLRPRGELRGVTFQYEKDVHARDYPVTED
jgi:hypothetical protein